MALVRLITRGTAIRDSQTFSFSSLAFYCTHNSENSSRSQEAGGYARAFQKFEQIKDDGSKSTNYNFTSLLKSSKFVDLGDPEGKIVTGKIFHIVEDDLYIDFGWKFHCVCSRPKRNPSNYVRGAKVRLRINELELSSKFLGYEKDLTLLEADCELLGLAHDRIRTSSNESLRVQNI